MTDVFSSMKRSEIMRRIKSKGNKTTEWKIRSRLIQSGISGWKLNDKTIFGVPDFVFSQKKIVVFLDGCFWHGCKTCRSIPKNNSCFWLQKISRNKERDRKVNRLLRRNGWKVLRFWEHELKHSPEECFLKIVRSLN